MLDIQKIRKKWGQGLYELSFHAISRMDKRQISMEELTEVVMHGEVIEHYPDDKPFPSCLIMGTLRKGFPLYLVCSMNSKVHLITAHWMDPEKWLDPKTRRERK